MKEWQKLYKLLPVTAAEAAAVGRDVGNPMGPHGERTRTHGDRSIMMPFVGESLRDKRPFMGECLSGCVKLRRNENLMNDVGV